MKNVDPTPRYDFNQVMIRPQRSLLNSRSEVDLTREMKFLHSKKSVRVIPIIPANMDGIGTFAMAHAMVELGLASSLIKHYSVDELVEFYKGLPENAVVFYSMGITKEDYEKFVAVNKRVLIKFVNIDVANGYTQRFVNFVETFRKGVGKDVWGLMAGTVVTNEITQQLIFSGADIVRVGIGGGAFCLTRRQTGVGYPQLSAVMEAADAAHGLKGMVCSDGGCVHPGDLAKAFGAGADWIMLGNMMSGHDEGLAPDVPLEQQIKVGLDGRKHVFAYGMSSRSAQDKNSGGMANYRSSEGREVFVPYKGSVKNTVQDILGGLRSACTYIGASRLKEMSARTSFILANHQLNEALSSAPVLLV